jgi:hypothetical protein
VPLFWAAKISQPDLIYLQNQQALLVRMATHNQKGVKENPCLFRARTFHNKKRLYLIDLTYLNNHMLAENGMSEQK